MKACSRKLVEEDFSSWQAQTLREYPWEANPLEYDVSCLLMHTLNWGALGTPLIASIRYSKLLPLLWDTEMCGWCFNLRNLSLPGHLGHLELLIKLDIGKGQEPCLIGPKVTFLWASKKWLRGEFEQDLKCSHKAIENKELRGII